MPLKHDEGPTTSINVCSWQILWNLTARRFSKVVISVKSSPVTGSLNKDRALDTTNVATTPNNLLNNKILFLFFEIQIFQQISLHFLDLKKLHTTFGPALTEQNEKGVTFFFKKIKTYFLY